MAPNSEQLAAMDLIVEAFVKAQTTVPEDRPLVTITWAQSLDGKLSAAPGERTLISGPESMQMTHTLRTLHDGIVVGSNTLLTDKPRLTARMSPDSIPSLSASLARFDCPPRSLQNPVPIILDSRLRTPPSAPCLHNNLPAPHFPLVVSSASNNEDSLQGLAKVIRADAAKDGKVGVCLPSALKAVREEGIRSVMVEGGTQVLSSFVDEGLWDLAIVTIAPALFGAGASLQAPPGSGNSFRNVRFTRSRWVQLGDDGIVVGFRI